MGMRLGAVFLVMGLAACGGGDDAASIDPALACEETGGCDDSQGTAGDDPDDSVTEGTGADSLEPGEEAEAEDSESLVACPEIAQGSTVGVLSCSDGLEPGYTLFAPIRSTMTYLVDVAGRVVHSWESDYTPGLSVYLLEDGRLLRTINTSSDNNTIRSGGAAGGIEILDWDGSVLWRYSYNTDDYRSHHDIEYLPNGNILMLAWEKKTAEEVLARGRDTLLLPDGELWVDHILELEPIGFDQATVVWEWHLWDHLVQEWDASLEGFGRIADHPERLDINFVRADGGADWNHINSIDYNPDLDQIVMSSHHMSEIYIIDHSTTSEEAAGHSGGVSGRGGDFLYRWGNPQVYQRGTDADQVLFLQHDARWIEADRPGAGQIMIFNNGSGRAGSDYSSVDVIEPPLQADGSYSLADGRAYGPSELAWTYVGDDSFFSRNISGAHRLSNGNTLVCDGPAGAFREVTLEGERVWDYVNPVVMGGIVAQGNPIPSNQRGQENTVFRATRYRADYPGLAGRVLAPGATLESTGTR